MNAKIIIELKLRILDYKEAYMKNLIILIFVLVLIGIVFCTEKVDSIAEARSSNSISEKEEFRMENVEKEAIKRVIEKAYIQGIHGNQDEKTVKSGFHQDFNMLVLRDNSIDKVNVDEWLERVEKMKADNPKLWEAETTYDFKLIDLAGYAAVAKIDVYKGEVHFSTDYMLLYKFKEGWRIVSKIFVIPD